jgi:hypothetical protein
LTLRPRTNYAANNVYGHGGVSVNCSLILNNFVLWDSFGVSEKSVGSPLFSPGAHTHQIDKQGKQVYSSVETHNCRVCVDIKNKGMKHDKEKELPRQFEFIEKAQNATMEWAKVNNIQLFKIEFVVPFVLTDKSLSVWLFFDTNDRVKEYENNGSTKKVKQQFLQFLKNSNYPNDYLGEVDFLVDSDENVKTNYEGSYFNRLR